MHKHLFFVCPTDYLEPVINDSFPQRNYYISSLGNSVVFDSDTILQVEELIKKHDIREISFVLSTDNQIVSDAFGRQGYAEVSGMNDFYLEITKQLEVSTVTWPTSPHQRFILSYYLNSKIKALAPGLRNLIREPIKINGKIYSKQEKRFIDIQANLIYRDYYGLN